MSENIIFLCHASENKRIVTDFYDKLKEAELNPWMDKMNLKPGHNWDSEIRKNLKNSKFIIIFLSKESTSKRGYVQREFKLAIDTLQEIPENQIFIIPVRIDECEIPISFQHIHCVDLFNKRSVHDIIKTIKEEIGDKQKLFNQEQKKLNWDEFQDTRNGRVYKMVKLNDGNTWMAENLDFELEEGCWEYQPKQNTLKNHGKLYTWNACFKACPEGWHIPKKWEWEEMVKSYGGLSLIQKILMPFFPSGNMKAGRALVKGGISGFNALYSGYKLSDSNEFYGIESFGKYWTATEDDRKYAWGQTFNSSETQAFTQEQLKNSAYSIRCVKD